MNNGSIAAALRRVADETRRVARIDTPRGRPGCQQNRQDGSNKAVEEMRTLLLATIGLLLAGTAGAHGSGADAKWQGYRADLVSASEIPAMRHGRHGDYEPGSRLDKLLNWNLNSGVCDPLADATPGLRMMCVAFCEMQSCTPDFTLEDPFQSCSKSSKWILARYEARRGPGDPDMPCIAQPEAVPECPCWTREELAGLRGLQSGDRPSCVLDLDAPSAGIVNMDSWRIFSSDTRSYVASVASTEVDTDGAASCQFTDRVCDPLTGECSVNVSRYLGVTPDQLAACEADVAMSAADRGLACTVMP